MIPRLRRLLLASLLGLIQPLSTFAQGDPVTLQELPRDVLRAVSPAAWLAENHVQTGLDGTLSGHLLVEVQLETRNGFQIYEDKTEFRTISDPSLGNREWNVEVVGTPKAYEFFDPVTKGLKRGYRGESIFHLKLNVPPGTKGRLSPGAAIPLVAKFQACNDKLCLFPVAVQLDLRLAGSGEPQRGLMDRVLGSLTNALSQGGGFGVMSFLGLLLAGLLTAFTPCVYPLYPITIGIFGRWSAGGRTSAFGLALAYCGGLTLSYAALGLVSAATGSVFGSLTQRPAFLIVVGLLILFSAAFFSGLFEFQLPVWLSRIFGGGHDGDLAKASRLGLLGRAFAMGAGLGVVASPCVGPVLVVLLAWLSTQLQGGGSAYLTGFAALAVFGVGMSLPFLAIGHLIVRMGRRPTLGRFTPYFKHVGTVLMVAGSLFFLIPGIQLAMGSRPDRAERAYKVYHLANWTKERPSVIDFRADWCTACLQLERETYPDPQVSQSFQSDFDFVEVDLTETTPETEKIAKDFGVVSLPTVLITRPGGAICRELSLYGFENASAFRARLERARSECR